MAVIEEPAVLEAEITVTEDKAALIRLGQPIELKVRACPFDTLTATVNRIESTVRGDEGQRSLIVICQLSNADGLLRAGMSGHALIYTEQCYLGEFLVLRVPRFLRTEFWC
jgi:hypothetical protein